jgi:hypothetical protein
LMPLSLIELICSLLSRKLTLHARIFWAVIVV